MINRPWGSTRRNTSLIPWQTTPCTARACDTIPVGTSRTNCLRLAWRAGPWLELAWTGGWEENPWTAARFLGQHGPTPMRGIWHPSPDLS
jgi:hypothetical protein